MTTDDVLKRVEKLEAANRRLRRWLWFVGIVAGLSLFATFVEQATDLPLFGSWEWRTVRYHESYGATTLNLFPASHSGDWRSDAGGKILTRPEYVWIELDKGFKSQFLLVSDADGATLKFLDSKEKVRLAMGMTKDRPYLVVYDAEGKAVSSLIPDNGQP